MKKCLLFFLTLLLFTCASFKLAQAHDVPALTYGVPGSRIGQSGDDLEELIKKYEKKIKDLQGKEKTLQNDIDSLDDQISLIQLRIQEANRNIKNKEEELAKLEDDIGVLSGKIVKLGDAVKYQSLLFNERIRSRYKSEHVSLLEYMFMNNLNDIVQRVRFIKAVEEQDFKLISQLRESKKNYESQKLNLEEKKAKVEEVKKRILIEKQNSERYNADLARQRNEKNALLNQTQGDEAKYQELLKQAKAELDAINGAVASVNFANGEKVDKGEAIAVMGNSGYPSCSTGAHLHFEVRKNGSVVNAESYLKQKTVYVDDFVSGYKSIGSGKWDWPMKNMQITQRYGKTPWSWRYSGNSHTGVDMISSNTLIYAPEKGTIVKGVAGCYGVGMNYAAIDHGGGVVSYYFHIK